MVEFRIVVVAAENLDPSYAKAGTKMYCVVQKSGTFATLETKKVDSATDVRWDENFTLKFENPEKDAILVCVFTAEDEDDYGDPIGSLKIPVNPLMNGAVDKRYDLATYSDSKRPGVVRVIAGVAADMHVTIEAPDESDGGLMSEGSDGEMTSDAVRRRRRRPVDFVPAHGHGNWQDVDVTSLGGRERKRHRKRKVAGELKESGTGATLDKLMMQRKDGSLNAALERLKMDPVKMKAFADYAAVMSKNAKLIKAAKDEGRSTDDGTIKKELSAVTVRSIKFAIEETKEWIEKIKNV